MFALAISSPPIVDGCSVAFADAWTLSTVTPLDTPATVASTSTEPPTLPFNLALPLRSAGSKPSKVPFALTCAVSFAICASNASCGTWPPMIVVSVSVPFAVTSMSFDVAPRPFAVT